MGSIIEFRNGIDPVRRDFEIRRLRSFTRAVYKDAALVEGTTFFLRKLVDITLILLQKFLCAPTVAPDCSVYLVPTFQNTYKILLMNIFLHTFENMFDIANMVFPSAYYCYYSVAITDKTCVLSELLFQG